MVAGEARGVGAGVAVEDADDGAEGRGGLEAALVLEHLVGLGDGDGYVAGVAAREVAPPEEPVAALRAGGGVPRGGGGRRGGPDTAARREEPEDRAQHAPDTSPNGASPRSGGTGTRGRRRRGVVRWAMARCDGGGGRNRPRTRKTERGMSEWGRDGRGRPSRVGLGATRCAPAPRPLGGLTHLILFLLSYYFY